MSIKELRLRHETGAKVNKNIARQIRQQLSRKCQVPGCDNSLAFKHSDAKYCEAHHGNGSALIRRRNRIKRQRYNRVHGIVRKTPRKVIQTVGVEPDELIYENYKEPLKKVEKGYGYYGTIATNPEHDRIQCHFCGNMYPNLGQHIGKGHGIRAKAYKEKFGLGVDTALISDKVREVRQQAAVKRFGEGKLSPALVQFWQEVKEGKRPHPKMNTNGSMHLKRRNELGLCPDQVLLKIQELAKELGRTPSMDEFKRRYNYKYLGSIKYLHGSWIDAVKKAGLVPAREVWSPSNEYLLEKLVEFREKYNRIPMTSDFKRGLLPSRGMYFRRFGTLNNARLEAGMNAVVSMPFGKVVELTADEYAKYMANHPIDKFTDFAARQRARRHARAQKLKEVMFHV